MFRRTRLPQTMPPSTSYQQPIRRLDAAFRPYESVGSHKELFRGSITRPAHPLSTLRSVSYLTTT